MSIRPVKQITQAVPTMEGAGVKLHRAFGFGKTEDFDPFLLFDDFRNDKPQDYLAGFPWHPHRGIETITYVLAGSVEHGDSLGNRGVLSDGDIQWMTAGSGIIHQEMPAGNTKGLMHGFQLWANLPSSMKMTSPRYQDIQGKDIPLVQEDDGTVAKVICGDFWGKSGPVDGIAASPSYIDISLPPNTVKEIKIAVERHTFAYVFAGSGIFDYASKPQAVAHETLDGNETKYYSNAGNRSLVLFDTGDRIKVKSGPEGLRFLLVSGKPIEEPVAWYGPIVMNTQAEIQQAMRDLQTNNFLRH
jgi:redox-sensitive bicupin YhaK (pirin superfamily)